MSETNVCSFNSLKEEIYRIILDTYQLKSKDELLQFSKKNVYVEPRYMLIRGLYAIGLTEREVVIETRRDRTSIIHAIKTLADWGDTNAQIRDKIAQIDKLFHEAKNNFRNNMIKEHATVVEGDNMDAVEENEKILILSANKSLLLEFAEWLRMQGKNSLTLSAREFIKKIIKSIEG